MGFFEFCVFRSSLVELSRSVGFYLFDIFCDIFFDFACFLSVSIFDSGEFDFKFVEFFGFLLFKFAVDLGHFAFFLVNLASKRVVFRSELVDFLRNIVTPVALEVFDCFGHLVFLFHYFVVDVGRFRCVIVVKSAFEVCKLSVFCSDLVVNVACFGNMFFIFRTESVLFVCLFVLFVINRFCDYILKFCDFFFIFLLGLC